MLNRIKTIILLGGLAGLMLLIGSYFGKTGLFIGLIFAIATNFFSYFYSDKLVLSMYRARKVKESDFPRLWRIVKEVSRMAKIKMPKVYVIPSHTPNAFATGRNEKNAAVACTVGILEILNDEELKGVIAHEISHIKNRDILIQTIACTIGAVISYLAMMARWAAIFGGYRDERRGGGIELLALAIIAPIVALIIQLAISRSREYLADESAAKLLYNPKGLASALRKLEIGIRHNPMRFGNSATSSLFIVNPFRGEALITLFSTHPPIKKRIERLLSLKL